MPTFDHAAEVWDAWAAKFRDQKLQMPDENLIRLFSGRYVNVPPAPARVLDHGFGSANTLLWLATRGYTCSGCEVSQALVDEGVQRFREAELTADLRLVTDHTLPFESASQDVIVSWNVLHYYADLDNAQAVIAEFHRILRPGGVLLLSTVHQKSSIMDRTQNLGGGSHKIVKESPYDNRAGLVFFVPDDNLLQSLFSQFSSLQTGSTHFDLFCQDKKHWARLLHAVK